MAVDCRRPLACPGGCRRYVQRQVDAAPYFRCSTLPCGTRYADYAGDQHYFISGAALSNLGERLAGEAGLEILRALLEDEVTRRVGPPYRPDPATANQRWGHQPGYVVFGGQKIGIARTSAISTLAGLVMLSPDPDVRQWVAPAGIDPRQHVEQPGAQEDAHQ